MTELLIDDKPCIHTIAQIGVDDRYHFVCKNKHECQVRRLLDDYFDRLSDHFDDTKSLHDVTGCDAYPWRSGRMNISHGIDDYIRSLNLPTDGTDNFVSIVAKPNLEPPAKQRRLPLTTGKNAKLPKGSDWEQPLFPSNPSSKSKINTPSKPSQSSASDATSTTSHLTNDFTRVDSELERIHNMVISSNATNTSSLKSMEESMSARIEHTTNIIGKVADGQAAIHTQLNTLHTNIATMNEANTLLSDNLHNKINALSTHVESLVQVMNSQFGARTDPSIQSAVQQMQITHTHNTINELGLPPSPSQREALSLMGAQ